MNINSSKGDAPPIVGYRQRFLLLIVLILAMLLLVPIVQEVVTIRVLLGFLITAIFITTVYAASPNERHLIIGVFLALVMLTSLWSPYLFHNLVLFTAGKVCAVLFFLIAITAILKFIFNARKVDKEIMYAAMVVYLLNLQSTTSAALAIVLALGLLLLFCFVVGAMLRTRLGAWTFERFERLVLRQIPGYAIISNVLKGFAENKIAYPAAMVNLFKSGTGVFGFVMEENEKGLVTVYVPSSPVLTVGTVHLVERERVTILDASAIAVTDCVSQWGIGAQKIIGEMQP